MVLLVQVLYLGQVLLVLHLDQSAGHQLQKSEIVSLYAFDIRDRLGGLKEEGHSS